ncbi:hypothetical protein GYMLUDRAFT_115212, partial [Collybiopsis luxurians FD-317 M1]
DIVRQMPIWHHAEAPDTRRLYRKNPSRCLRETHGITTVGETEALAQLTRTPRHTRRRNCSCEACKNVRTQHGCQAPYRCYQRATELLNALPPKWNPTAPQPEDYEPEELTQPAVEGGVVFDHRITEKGSLADAFRIFTTGTRTNGLPATDWGPGRITPRVHVYTDGSCQHNGGENARAGAGIFCASDDTMNRAIRIPASLPQTNQTGEIVSIKESAEMVEPHDELVILSD